MNWAATSPSDRLADAIVVSGWSAIEQAESPLEFYYRPADRFVSGFTDPPENSFHSRRVGIGHHWQHQGVAIVGVRRDDWWNMPQHPPSPPEIG